MLITIEKEQLEKSLGLWIEKMMQYEIELSKKDQEIKLLKQDIEYYESLLKEYEGIRLK